jgi:hypothetical protein
MEQLVLAVGVLLVLFVVWVVHLEVFSFCLHLVQGIWWPCTCGKVHHGVQVLVL